MKKIAKKSLVLAAFSLLSSIGVAQANPLSCFHVIEGTCRAEETNDHVGFIAITWPMAAGADIGVESCAYSIDVQYKFYDYLKTTFESPTLCRPGDVFREDIHEYRRYKRFDEAQAAFQELKNRCMEPNNGFIYCVTVEELDLDGQTGRVQVLNK